MTRDPIVDSVRSKMLARSRVGLAKYGVGLNRSDLTRKQWLEHTQNELMDAVNYLEVLIQAEPDDRPAVGGHSNAVVPGHKIGPGPYSPGRHGGET